MITLGLDISSKSTGVSVFDGEKLIFSTCLVATSTNKFNRIKKITNELEEIVKQYKPTDVIVEDPLPADVGHNQKVYKVLTYAQGSIGMMLNDYKLEMKFYTSSEWRKKVGISKGQRDRNSMKQKSIDLVNKMYSKKVNDDEADAILIGYAYVQENNTISF